MAENYHIKKIEKSPYVHHRLADFNEIWHGDASGTSITN